MMIRLQTAAGVGAAVCRAAAVSRTLLLPRQQQRRPTVASLQALQGKNWEIGKDTRNA
jgi:hypothetical protein